jgi:hypothetical protein
MCHERTEGCNWHKWCPSGKVCENEVCVVPGNVTTTTAPTQGGSAAKSKRKAGKNTIKRRKGGNKTKVKAKSK